MISTLAVGAFLAMPRLPKLDWSAPARYKRVIVLNRAKGFDSKTIALTFDDGPDPKVTPRILDTLKKYEVKATFFVLGPLAKRHPQLLRRMVVEGHCIANHSWSHGKEITKENAVVEIMRTNAVIRKATGNDATLFRPPYGITNNEYAAQAKAMGMPVVLWTRIDNDSVAKDVKSMLAAIGTPKNGDIILCHDGPGRSSTAQMLPVLLANLTKSKYEFATVPELLRSWDAHLVALSRRETATKVDRTKPSFRVASIRSTTQRRHP